MGYKTVFKRQELKYIVTKEQKAALIRAASKYMKLDEYGRTSIRNIYYDTENFELIRHSIEKPVYKEKLRVRSYGAAACDSTVFVELKKKYMGTVYKRRMSLKEKDAVDWIEHGIRPAKECQIANEIDYFIHYYKDLRPAVYLSYEREAYYMKDGSDFRMTFDENLLARTDHADITDGVGGDYVLDKNLCIMELKISNGMPLWMSHLLSEMKIYKTTFSKYGTAYKNMIYKKVFTETKKEKE